MSAERYTAGKTSARTAAVLLVFALVFTAAMALTWDITHPLIEQARTEEKMRLIDAVLPAARYDNDLLDDRVRLAPVAALGLEEGGLVYRARKDGQPVALVLEAVAHDGYGGDITLVIAVDRDGRVTGVRVTGHSETPGLGDYVDIKKDRRRDRPWIRNFDGVSLDEVPPERFRVRKDGGHFDAHTGATISARAVVEAVGRALVFARQHADALFAVPRDDTYQAGTPS